MGIMKNIMLLLYLKHGKIGDVISINGLQLRLPENPKKYIKGLKLNQNNIGKL